MQNRTEFLLRFRWIIWIHIEEVQYDSVNIAEQLITRCATSDVQGVGILEEIHQYYFVLYIGKVLTQRLLGLRFKFGVLLHQ